jgi:hypothetical protein
MINLILGEKNFFILNYKPFIKQEKEKYSLKMEWKLTSVSRQKFTQELLWEP